jgi:hypothetical protein
MKELCIDTCTYNDYDTVVRFLLEHGIPIKVRNKVKMFVVAEVPQELLPQLYALELEEIISTGDSPL